MKEEEFFSPDPWPFRWEAKSPLPETSIRGFWHTGKNLDEAEMSER